MDRLDFFLQVTDPIRLVRMVNKMDRLPRSARLADESPSPTRQRPLRSEADVDIDETRQPGGDRRRTGSVKLESLHGPLETDPPRPHGDQAHFSASMRSHCKGPKLAEK